MRISAISIAGTLCTFSAVDGFVGRLPTYGWSHVARLHVVDGNAEDTESESSSRRRDLLHSAAVTSGSILLGGANPMSVDAAVGTLPEFADSDAIIQGVTVKVADESQQAAMIDFLVNGFDFEILRKRLKDPVEETVRTN